MRMNKHEAWKNFNLGQELSISGAFIYNGLRRFHEMQVLDHTDEIFEFLYNLSVGLERLLKIAVVLVEHEDDSDQEALEKSLITHNHLELMKRVRQHCKFNLGTPHNQFLALLGTFYTSLRYDRFTLSSVWFRVICFRAPERRHRWIRASATGTAHRGGGLARHACPNG
jgi:hypothetical protein